MLRDPARLTPVTALRWLVVRHARRRLAALLGVALLVAIGSAGTFVALAAGERTRIAYPRYLSRAAVGDAVLNPGVLTTRLDAAIRDLPGVRSVTSDHAFAATLDDGASRTLGELQRNRSRVFVVGSTDGRHTAMDRPALAAGRPPAGPGEAMVGDELAAAHGVGLGDRLPVAFWRAVDPSVEDPAQIVSPLGIKEVEIVGVGTLFPDAALPDTLYSPQSMVVSPQLAARYQCLPEPPAPDASLEVAIAAISPPSCASEFSDYSVELVDGAGGVDELRQAALSTAADLNGELPESLRAAGIAYDLTVSSVTSDQRERVERSIQPIVAALFVLALAAGIVTFVVSGIAINRSLRNADVDQRQWWELGLTSPARVTTLTVPIAVAVLGGLVAGLAIAWWCSRLGPVGSVRSVDPTPGRSLPGPVWIAALVVGTALVSAITARAWLAAARVSRRRLPPAISPWLGRLLHRVGRPEVGDGIRAAYARRSSRPVLASGIAGAAVFLTAVVFTTSLSTLVSTPRAYGWPWDLAVVSGLGWGGTDLDAVSDTLAARDDVDNWTGLGFAHGISLNGEPEFAVVGLDDPGPVDVTVINGRLPAGPGEVALGARTASERGIAIGDRVELTGDALELSGATVTGHVVFPALGPLGGERARPGTGILVPASTLDDHFLAADGLGRFGFVGISLAPGTDADEVLRELEPALGGWDRIFEVPLSFAGPVRPPEIVDVQSMSTVPFVAGVLMVTASAFGLAAAVVSSVRTRRHELAILRALGFTGRQLRTSVRVQSIAMMSVALVVGAPIGIVSGRVAWQAFAASLGVATTASVPALAIVLTVLGGLVLALVASAVPARIAGRAGTANVPRSE